jgi:hypothetical protein
MIIHTLPLLTIPSQKRRTWHRARFSRWLKLKRPRATSVMLGGPCRGECGPWWSIPVECRICGHREVTVCPVGTDIENLECAECGNMTCEPQETDE